MSSTQDFTSSRFSIPSAIRAWISRLTGCWLLCIDTEARRISLFVGTIGGLAIDPSLDRTEGPTVRIGLQVPRFTWPDAPDSIGPKLAEIGRTADETGFASIWVMDHFFQIGVVGDAESVRRLLARHPLLESETPIYAVDVSVWDRCDAECSPERGFYYHPRPDTRRVSPSWPDGPTSSSHN